MQKGYLLSYSSQQPAELHAPQVKTYYRKRGKACRRDEKERRGEKEEGKEEKKGF